MFTATKKIKDKKQLNEIAERLIDNGLYGVLLDILEYDVDESLSGNVQKIKRKIPNYVLEEYENFKNGSHDNEHTPEYMPIIKARA